LNEQNKLIANKLLGQLIELNELNFLLFVFVLI